MRGVGEAQRIIGVQREANYGQATVGLSSPFFEKQLRLRDLGLGVLVVGVAVGRPTLNRRTFK